MAVIGIAAAVWARAPITPAAVDWRKIEKLCAANGSYYYRIDGPFQAKWRKWVIQEGVVSYSWEKEEWCCPSY